MFLSIDRALTFRARRAATGIVVIALALGGLGLSGCSIVRAVKKIAHNVEANKATMSAFTTNMKSSEATPFQATYVTTGSSPTTVVYAVQPPKDLSFTETPSGGNSGGNNPTLSIIVNSSGAYTCTPPAEGAGSSAVWSCNQYPAVNAAARRRSSTSTRRLTGSRS